MKKIQELFKAKDAKLHKYTIILSLILSIFLVLGHSLNTYYDLREIYGSIGNAIISILKIGIFATIIYFAIILITNLLQKTNSKPNKEYKFLTTNKKSFFLAWGIIFVAWIPYFMQYFPGILSPDSIREIMQVVGQMNYTTHHPIIHTLIIKLFIDIGSIFGDIPVGIMLYSIAQMLTMSAIFAFAVYYMSKIKMPNGFRIFSLASFAIYPIHAIYAVTMWKDILFGGIILLLTIWIYEFITNPQFIETKKSIIFFIIMSIMLIMLRKNGIFVILFTIPCLLLLRKDKIKRILLLTLATFILYFVLHTSLVTIFNAEKGEIREALAVPIQQMARVVKYEDISDEQLAQIKKFIQSDEIATLYNPILADPIKDCVNSEMVNQNMLEFITLWITIFFQHPLQCIEAFLCNSYGYWYPEIDYWIIAGWGSVQQLFGVQPIIQSSIISNIVDFCIEQNKLPILFSIGGNCWIMLIALMLCLYKKSYKLVTAFIPVIVVILTSMASPVFGEFRYVYGLFTTLLFLLAITYKEFIKK